MPGQVVEHLCRTSRGSRSLKISCRIIWLPQTDPFIDWQSLVESSKCRAVRAEACRVQQALAASLKRRMAPVLKSVIRPWWLAQHDTASEVAAAANESFQAAFPEARHQEAILFCAQEVRLGFCAAVRCRPALDMRAPVTDSIPSCLPGPAQLSVPCKD